MNEGIRVSGASALAAVCLLAACGGAPEAPQPQADAPGGESIAQLGVGVSGPDPAQARQRLLLNANMAVPDAARIVSYRETGLRYDGPPQMQTAIVAYEAEIEFTADTYFYADHKAGDRAQVHGEIEYLNEGGGWRLVTMGIDPR